MQVSRSSEHAAAMQQQQQQQHPENLVFMPGHPAAGVMTYSPFPSMDGSWGFDPSLAPSGFAFPATNVLAPQSLPQYYIPNADMSTIWGQDAFGLGGQDAFGLVNYQTMMSPIAVDHQQQQQQQLQPAPPQQQQQDPTASLPADSNSVAADPMTGLGHNLAAIALNGSAQDVSLPSNTAGSSGGGDSSPESSMNGSSVGQNTAPQPEKPKSWAAIASQPAKPKPPPPKPQPPPQPQESKAPDVASSKRGTGVGRGQPQHSKAASGAQGNGGGRSQKRTTQNQSQQQPQASAKSKSGQSELVGKLQAENKYNPSKLSVDLNNARYFVIKSYAEDDIHRSIKYSIWTSTEHGNRRLDQAFKEQKGKGPIYLFFSVNGSGHFCGMAQMASQVDLDTITGIWAQDKWKGRFDVRWIYVKDVPNNQLRHIRLENNENKPVTNSRDTQEVFPDKGKQVVSVVHNYNHTTSIFDDFDHYEKKQGEDSTKKVCK